MSGRTLSRLAWSLAALTACLALAEIVMSLRDPSVGYLGTGLQDGLWVVAFLVFAVIGALILSRLPTLSVGWMFVFIGAGFDVEMLITRYGINAMLNGDRAAPLVAWIGNWLWAPTLLLIATGIPLFFPDGRLASDRWRAAAWLGAAAIAITTLIGAFRPGPLDHPFESGTNPFAAPLSPDLFRVLRVVSAAAILGAIFASGAAVVARYRRAEDIERQQLKWFMSAAVVTIAFYAVLLVSAYAIDQENLGMPAWAANIVPFVTALIPVASIIAIFRYRLYDIDVLVQRALLYGLLTAILAGFFVGAQTLSQRTFAATTGANSDIAVALSLFVIVAVFTPLKERLQALITRRFRAPSGHTAAAVGDVFEALQRLGQLHTAGVLTDREFETKKAELLARI